MYILTTVKHIENWACC